MRFVDICYHCSAETHITFSQSTNYTRDNKESKVTSHCPHNIRAGNSNLKKEKNNFCIYTNQTAVDFICDCMLVTVTYSKIFCIVWCFGFGIIRLSYSTKWAILKFNTISKHYWSRKVSFLSSIPLQHRPTLVMVDTWITMSKGCSSDIGKNISHNYSIYSVWHLYSRFGSSSEALWY